MEYEYWPRQVSICFFFVVKIFRIRLKQFIKLWYLHSFQLCEDAIQSSKQRCHLFRVDKFNGLSLAHQSNIRQRLISRREKKNLIISYMKKKTMTQLYFITKLETCDKNHNIPQVWQSQISHSLQVCMTIKGLL